jgi:hypothetical protein
VSADGFGAFYLNAEEAGSVVEDEVVAEGISPGLGDAEAVVGGAVEEGGFGAFSGDFCVFAFGLGLASGFGSGRLWSGHLILPEFFLRSFLKFLAARKRRSLGLRRLAEI